MRTHILRALPGALLALAALFGLSGCGGGSNDTYNPALVTGTGGPAPTITVAVSPPSATTLVGGTQAFTATVTGTSNTAVTWSVSGGSANGTITNAGVYTAPGTPGTYTIVATSQADTSRRATATVTVQAIAPTTGNLNGTIQ